jgi:hypothetical protein
MAMLIAPLESPASTGRARSKELSTVRYRWLDRFSDRRNGAKDGRKGLPDVSADPVATPTFDALGREFDELSEQERENMLTDVGALLRAEHESDARRMIAATVVIEREKEADSASTPLGPDDLRRRVGGESDTDPGIVAARRLREHAAAAAKVEATLATARAELRVCEVRLAQLRGAIRVREAIGAAAVRRAHAHYNRRLACYQRSLVRKHPDGVQLNGLLEARRPKLPPWVERTGDYPLFPDGQP